MEQRALAGRADPGDFVERAFGELLLAPRPMGSDGESMRLVAQALNEIKRRIARGQPERLRPAIKKVSRPALRSGPLAIAATATPVDAKFGENPLRRVELSLAAVDQDKVRPMREDVASSSPAVLISAASCPGTRGLLS